MSRGDLASMAREKYDLIIVGGGIHGAMLALEGSGRGLAVLLVEKNDFGSATSFNSLRIVHGGLRYLQSLNVGRFFQSVGERRWFLANFPDLVKPLGCLMPLYNRGMKRKSTLRMALFINDVLSRNRNRGVPAGGQLPGGQVLGIHDTVKLFPAVDQRKIKGGAIWYDAAMPDSQRIVIEILRWAVAQGAGVINYAEVAQLIAHNGMVQGVIVRDRLAHESIEVNAPVVINATGPWCRQTADKFGSDSETLFRPSIAWNILLKREALSDFAIAVAPPRGGQLYFLHPWKGRLLIGTGHRKYLGSCEQPEASENDLKTMLDDINLAIPGLMLNTADIDCVFSGLLPARNSKTFRLADSPIVLDHSTIGGPAGLTSVSGVKFTTSRLVARHALTTIFGDPGSISRARPRPEPRTGWSASGSLAGEGDLEGLLRDLKPIIDQEWVVHLDDLVVRRTTLWENLQSLSLIMPRICGLFPWDADRQAQEIKRVNRSTVFKSLNAATDV